jgi:hypothetical protein
MDLFSQSPYRKSVSTYLNELTRTKSEHAPVEENLGGGTQDVAAKILAFAAARNRDPRALTSEEKGEILQQLAAAGELERRGAAEKIAAIMGLSRSNIYYYLRKSRATGEAFKSQPSLKVGDVIVSCIGLPMSRKLFFFQADRFRIAANVRQSA